MGFNLIRINILAVGEDDKFLAASGDEQVPAGIEVAEIAGMQPAIFNRVGGGVGPVPVAFHHDGAANQDFADRLARLFGGLRIENFRLDGWQRWPHRANDDVTRRVQEGCG